MISVIKAILQFLGVLPKPTKTQTPNLAPTSTNMIVRLKRERVAKIIFDIQSNGMEWWEKSQLWSTLVEKVNSIPDDRVGHALELALQAKEAYSHVEAGDYSRFTFFMETMQLPKSN